MQITNFARIKPISAHSAADYSRDEKSLPSLPRAGSPELIHTLFRYHSAVSVVGDGDTATRACEGLATELSLRGRRVVIVSVPELLRARPIPHPDNSGLAPEEVWTAGAAGMRDCKFWIWPPLNRRARATEAAETKQDWLSPLCLRFDHVFLDCSELQKTPGCAAIALMAESAVLAVEMGRTFTAQILRNRQVLEAAGVKVAGSIVVDGR